MREQEQVGRRPPPLYSLSSILQDAVIWPLIPLFTAGDKAKEAEDERKSVCKQHTCPTVPPAAKVHMHRDETQHPSPLLAIYITRPFCPTPHLLGL